MKPADKLYAVLDLLTAIAWFMISTDERSSGKTVSVIFGILMICAAVHTIWKGKHRH